MVNTNCKRPPAVRYQGIYSLNRLRWKLQKPDVVGTTPVNGWKNRANKRTTNWKILHICMNSSLVCNILWPVLALKGNRNSTWVYVGLDDKTQWKTPLTYVTSSSQWWQHVCSSRKREQQSPSEVLNWKCLWIISFVCESFSKLLQEGWLMQWWV